jgi:hypothetical protein
MRLVEVVLHVWKIFARYAEPIGTVEVARRKHERVTRHLLVSRGSLESAPDLAANTRSFR